MTRYVVLGAGAVGVTLAAQLRASGRDVVVVGRGGQLEHLRAGTLRYVRPDGTTRPALATAAGPAEVELGPADVLVLTTKTQDADTLLAQWAAQPVRGTTATAGAVLPVVTPQNGFEAERIALRHFATVIGAVLWVPSTYVTDGEVVSPAAPAVGLFWLGAHPDGPAPAVVATLARDLRAAHFDVQVVDDLSRWKASKLLTSTTFALDALYAPGRARDRAARLVREETRAVLTAVGQDVADSATESTLDPARFRVHAMVGHDRPGSSSFQSLARGRRAETDHLNGEVVALARGVGRRAPLNAALQARVARAAVEGTAPGSLGDDDLAATLARATVLTDAVGLAAELRGTRPPALLDVRWALGDPDGEKQHLDGHLPGAVYVDLDTELAAPPSAGGRHPLPSPADLQRAVARWGLVEGGAVVVHDANGGQSAARAWWLLRWAGFTDVRILDGGLAAWTAAGGDLETGAVTPEPGDARVRPGALPVVDADDVAGWPTHGTLLDARAGERYRGEVEPVDPRAGHVPGAISLPTGGNLDGDGRFLPVPALRERFRDVEGDVAVYCGSGVTAAHQIAALQAAGIDAALFPGSWSAWSADPDRPAALGATP